MRAEVIKLARTFAALPVEPPEATIDAAQKLSHAAGELWTQLHWLKDWTRQLRGEAQLVNVIQFPRKA